MSEFDTRDRWVMLGLVVLGLFTVVAAVLSGRSTINYALEVEAGNAAQVWSVETDKNLRRVLSNAAEGSVSGGIHLLEPTILQKQFGDVATDPPTDAKASSSGNRQALANRLNWLTEGLAATIPGGSGDEHVSRMGGFAIPAASSSPRAADSRPISYPAF